MSISRARPNSKPIPYPIHRRKPQLIRQLITAIDIRKRAITLIIQRFQLLILSEYLVLGAVFVRRLRLLDGLLWIYSLEGRITGCILNLRRVLSIEAADFVAVTLLDLAEQVYHVGRVDILVALVLCTYWLEAVYVDSRVILGR